MSGGAQGLFFDYRQLLDVRCQSSEQFAAAFGTEAQCVEWLRRRRWPQGFACGRCGGDGTWIVERRGYACRRCRKFSSVTAGTLLHGTRKPIRKWFEALYLIVQRGVNARVLQREIGLTYKVAWTWGHKLRSLMGPLGIRPEYRAERRRGVPAGGGCGCTKLTKRDWCWVDDEDRRTWLERIAPTPWRHEPERPLPMEIFAHWDLLATYFGSMSEKHLGAYLDELSFRGVQRPERRPAEELFLLAVTALAQSEPRPYRKIVAKPEAQGFELSV
ncbi:MAG: transposase, partial [Planctomycetota bacterium]